MHNFTAPPGASFGTLPPASSISALGLPTIHSSEPGPYLSLPSQPLPPTLSLTQPIPSPLIHPPTTPAKDPLASLPDIPPLSAKLVEKILAWEYTDLSELLPDQLHSFDSPTSSQDAKVVLLPQQTWETQRRKRRQIIDIMSWIQVYSTYMLVISSRFPEALPDLIAYQLVIIKQTK